MSRRTPGTDIQQAQANAQNAARESKRRQELTTLAVTVEEKQTFASTAVAVQAQYQQAVAKLEQARVNLQRTEIRSPVNGWVTNLLAQLGDYANVGTNVISLVDADSFWVDGYFEETNLEPIRVGNPTEIKLMGYRQIVRGHVDSIARGINVANAEPNGQGLANVNPIFTWCAWRNASRCASTSIRCPKAWFWSPTRNCERICYRSLPAGVKIQARIGLASGAKGFEPRSPREKRIPLAPSTTLLQQQDAAVARQTKAHSTSRSRAVTADAPSARVRAPAVSDRTGQRLRQKVGQAQRARRRSTIRARRTA